MKAIGFVPVVDALIEATGSLHAAYVYGWIWVNRRGDGTFDEPLVRIAKEAHIGRSTTFKWVTWFVDNGYLTDLTPDRIGTPHEYICTDKVELAFSVSVEVIHNPTESGHPPSTKRTGTPSTKWTTCSPFGGRVPGHDMMHDDHDNISDGWTTLGLDKNALRAMMKIFAGREDSLAGLVARWAAAAEAGDIPDDWGPGLIYRKIQDGELPPERERSFGDEVLELMNRVFAEDDLE